MPRSDPKSSICVVGIGALTAVGLTAPSTAAAVRAGISGFTEHPFMIARNGDPMVVAAVPGLDQPGPELDRCCRLALEPLREALAPVLSRLSEVGPINVFVGLPLERPGRSARLEQQVAQLLRGEPGLGAVECISTGHAAGMMALEAASRHVRSNPSAFCLAGGIESYLEPETLEWVEQNDQLHGGENAYGFIPGEAAGYCLLCSQQAAERLSLAILARVWTAATAREKNLIKTDKVCLGRGLTEALQMVFAQLPAASDQIDRVICDLNGEPYRADEYGFAISRLTNRFVSASSFVAPADCWGDVGAASGPLFVSLVTASGQRRYDEAGYHLLWSSAESGERSAAILQQELRT